MVGQVYLEMTLKKVREFENNGYGSLERIHVYAVKMPVDFTVK